MNQDLLERTQEKLDLFLQQKGLRKTQERYKILECVVDLGRPFDAQTIWNQMSENFLSVSLTTVFSALDLFAQAGILIPMAIASSTHYILSEKCQEYSLLWCRTCGKITLYRQRKLLSTLRKSKPPRFKNESPVVLFYGECAICRNKSKSAD